METTPSTASNVDPLTKRPREGNEPYTAMSEEQKVNIGHDASVLFFVKKPEKPFVGRATMDRYATSMSQHYVRGPPLSNPYCYMGEKYSNDAEAPLSEKTGTRTLQYLTGDEPNRYLNMDYCRPLTNVPMPITFKYGRPNVGYYAAKNPPYPEPNWGCEEVDPNAPSYAEQLELDRQATLARQDEFPSHSEYTDKYFLRTKYNGRPATMEGTQKMAEQSA